PNSHCAHCYAKRGRYQTGSVKRALARRFGKLHDPQWVDAMVTLITNEDRRFFRWFDSGDLQGVWMLDNIAEVARRIPWCTFWLPTREYSIVERWLATNRRPRNLIIRLSGHLFDTYPRKLARRLGVHASGSHTKGATLPDGVFECHAHD